MIKKKKKYYGESFFCKGCNTTHDILTPFTDHCIVPDGFQFITPAMRRRDSFIKRARKADFTKKQAEFLFSSV